VNEAWVKEFLTKGLDPLAQAFQQKNGKNIAIVGVTGNARQNALEPARPEIDFPFSRFTLKDQQDAGSVSFFLYVHTAVPPLSIVPQLRAALHDIAPVLAFQMPVAMEDLLSENLVNNRMESWVLASSPESLFYWWRSVSTGCLCRKSPVIHATLESAWP